MLTSNKSGCPETSESLEPWLLRIVKGLNVTESRFWVDFGDDEILLRHAGTTAMLNRNDRITARRPHTNA